MTPDDESAAREAFLEWWYSEATNPLPKGRCDAARVAYLAAHRAQAERVAALERERDALKARTADDFLRRPDDGADDWPLGKRYNEICERARVLEAERDEARAERDRAGRLVEHLNRIDPTA